MSRALLAAATPLAVAALLAGPPARAGEPAAFDPPPGRSGTAGAVRARFAVDAAVTAAAGAGWIALAAAHRDLARTSCPCDRSDAPVFDRPAIDLRWRAGERAAHAAAAASLAVTIAGLGAAAPDARAFASDALIAAESMALAGLATQAAKTAAARPYPYLHDHPHPAQERDGVNYASFWSGHTAVPMAGAVAFAAIFHRRHPRSPWRWLVFAAAPALALAAGLLQMSAGNHFPSDVAAGAAAGAAVGWINPELHRLSW